MTILTRENLGNGSFRSHLAMPEHASWTDARLDQSFAETWAQRPGGPVWVFGYGSLIWNPLMVFEEQRTATLRGWHRSFCLRSISGRGSPGQPGRVLSLLSGGEVQGVALRLATPTARDEVRLLWTREMTGGSYVPRWLPVQLAGGGTVHAITFVANTEHPQHEQDASASTVARLVARARGVFGPNIDYVLALDRALREHGLHDPYIEAIMARMREASEAP
ncbi:MULTISPECIES: gamma-glutamylcyclotransferase [unclassified Acidovorax]|uniref:gamma-glutamylcyclotransferase n=1 Tax=unclassified Acidovorax TaxID=2684926 RepID=UPI001C47C723|nr:MULTISPECIES: gamma-glutamylcyclotransferase [unclassified Acidovorax]MBV7427211.1 gamma-glutamylcyclotransferase [Acidovorax sp. sif0732]MBV7448335.1 gamma-glutamylcyclotransferase [Acidovorax sp. sif0715]